MATDNDLLALLPDPPPPRAARREAAIAEAMRGFDGAEPSRPAVARPEPALWWRQPQLAALASIALVVTIGLPIMWQEKERIAEVVPRPPPSAQASPIAAPASETSGPGQPAAPAVNSTGPEAASAAPTADQAVLENGTGASLAQDAAPARAPSAPAQQRPDTTGYAAPPPPRAPARDRGEAARAAVEEESGEAEDANIVVTGSRVARPTYNSNSPVVSVDQAVLAGGNWNACTILDEDQSLRACPTRRASGRAATQLADGLNFAWQGDLDRAIDAFGDAIRTSPDFSLAYLNRGLAYQAKGDLRRALADFNRAVSSDRDNAAAYYHRSELHRARGDTQRADVDARRADELVGNE
jgi:hypothetical protein